MAVAAEAVAVGAVEGLPWDMSAAEEDAPAAMAADTMLLRDRRSLDPT